MQFSNGKPAALSSPFTSNSSAGSSQLSTKPLSFVSSSTSSAITNPKPAAAEVSVFGQTAKPIRSLPGMSSDVAKPTGQLFGGFAINKATPKCADESKSETLSNVEQDTDQLYVEQITELNVSVLAWIKQHIEENPLIDLMPVFKDYSKHMNEIDIKYGKTTSTLKTLTNSEKETKTPAVPATIVSPVTNARPANPFSASLTPLSGSLNGFKATGTYLSLLTLLFDICC